MRSRFLILWLAVMVATSALIFMPAAHVSHAATSGVVISALYGGGSDTGATYSHDYIEIFNAGANSVNLTNWSVQYRHASNTSSWQKTRLPAISLLPGQYLLLQQRSGLNRFTPLPTPDAFGAADMRRAGNFVVALMSNRTTIVGPNPMLDPKAVNHVQDLFGGGDPSTAVPTVFEGAYRSGVLTIATAWFRLNNGCQDTDNNLFDFEAANVYPNARNSASPLAPCGVVSESDVIVNVSDSSDPVVTGNVVTYTVTASNVGNATANNTVFTVDLSGSAYPGAISNISQGACVFATPTLTCTVGALAAAGTFEVTFNVTPTVTGSIVADASISADEPEAGGNNTDSETTTVVASGTELVSNGGFENGLTGWLKQGVKAKTKLICGAAGASSDCAVQIKTGGILSQKTEMAGILALVDTNAGDVLRLSTMVWSNRPTLKKALVVVVKYDTPTAGANANGKDKFKLTLNSVTMTYTEHSGQYVLADGIFSGSVMIRFAPLTGKARFDDVSVQLLPSGTVLRSVEVSGVLPLPAAPANLRGNN